MKGNLSLVIAFVFVIGISPSVWAGPAPENPVHERLKAWHDQHREIYYGQKIVNSDDIQEKDIKELTKDVEEENKDVARLSELMKEFDKDMNGIISADEMKKAEAVGRGKELKSLLEKEKARKEKADRAKKNKSPTEQSVGY